MHEWPLYPGTGRLDEAGDGRGRGHDRELPAARRARPATCTSTRSTGRRAARRALRAHLGADLGRLRRPPGRPADRARALGRRLRRPHRPGHGAAPRRGGSSCSSRAATTSTRCGTRPRRRSRPCSARPERVEPATATVPGRTVVHAVRDLHAASAASSSDRPSGAAESRLARISAPVGSRASPARADRQRVGPRCARCREVTPGEGRVLDLDQLLRNAVERGASDVHIKVGSPPFIRIDGRLERTDHRAGLAGRDRAHRVRDHAEAARRGVHRARPKPTSRTRCRVSAASA